MISLLLECMHRLSNWISKANNIINKNLVDKSSVVPITEKHQKPQIWGHKNLNYARSHQR